MATVDRAALKAKWIQGYRPTTGDYEDFFDSFVSLLDDSPISEAPEDGNIYGRLNSNWETIIPGGDVTSVGTGQTYTTLGAAITASKTCIKLVSSTTETGNIVIPAGTYIYSEGLRNNIVVAMGSYSFTSAANSVLENFTISFSKSAAGALFQDVYSEGIPYFICRNINFINTSTVQDACIAFTGDFENCIVTLPNQAYTGFGNAITLFDGNLTRIEFVGGGSSCSAIVSYTNTWIFRDLKFRGTFNTSISIIVVNVDGLKTNTAIGIYLFGTLRNARHIIEGSNPTILVSCRGTNMISVINSKISSITGESTSSRASFTNCTFPVSLTLSSNTCHFSFSNCYFTTLSITNTPNVRVQNCYATTINVSASQVICIGNYCQTSIVVAATNCIINNNVVANQTITFNTGANNNICVGNETDLAIVNNGTGNQLAYNVVF